MTGYLNQTFDLSDPDLVSVFDELPLWSSYFGAVILNQVKYKKGIRVLDIGCGAGFPLIELAQRLGESSDLYGIDPWSAALDRILQKIRFMNISNVRLLNQPAESLPFDDNTFDLIVSNNGINNVADPGKVLSECYRALKADGQFIMSVNLPGTMHEFYETFREVLTANDLSDRKTLIDKHISSKRKTVEENKALLTRHNFRIKDIKEDEFYMRFADGSAFLNHYFIKMAFLDSWVKIPPESKTEMIFSDIEERLNKSASENGQLNLTIPFAVFDCTKDS